MCGRYYVDDDTAREIEKLVRQMDENRGVERGERDVHPSEAALVVRPVRDCLRAGDMAWGFPGSRGRGLLFNARAETVMEKPTFADSVRQRRCLVPAKGFYEWDGAKNKVTFHRKDDPVLFMAGIYRRDGDGERFVILTTDANDSMRDVHDRMPLILERGQITDWLMADDEQRVKGLLSQVPVALERLGYFQQSFSL